MDGRIEENIGAGDAMVDQVPDDAEVAEIIETNPASYRVALHEALTLNLFPHEFPRREEIRAQLRNKWAYRVRQQHPPLPTKRVQHPTTGAIREFSTLPRHTLGDFMPAWVAWALRRIELDLRNQAEEIARVIGEMNIDDDAIEAVGQEPEVVDEDPE